MDEVELIGGPEKRSIVIVPYRPAWPATFEEHRRRIEDALGSVAFRVDHIGSTAVPGLAAKPIIDIQVSVSDIEDETPYLPVLVAAGYRLRVREPGHRMFRIPARCPPPCLQRRERLGATPPSAPRLAVGVGRGS